MVKENTWFFWQARKLHLHIYLQPRASSDAIVGIHGDCLKIRITAMPTENRANQHLVKLLAAYFKVPRERVIISQGEHNRKKWLIIDNPNDLNMLEPYFNENSASQS